MESISIGRLKNLGPKSVKQLNEIGVFTRDDLERIGIVMAYKVLKHHNPSVSILMLYALYGAMHDVHWNSLSPERKTRLRASAEGHLEIE